MWLLHCHEKVGKTCFAYAVNSFIQDLFNWGMTEKQKNILYEVVRQFVCPSEDEWEAFYSSFRAKSIPRNEVYLQQDQIAKYIALVVKGCFRMYFIIEGEERCKDFQIEGQFTGSLYSFISRKPALFSIAAVEDSEILEISRDQLLSLFDCYHIWERFGRMYIEQIFLYKEKREASLLNKSAKERYEEFITTQPALVQRLPLKFISSYLGIKPESLSRLRKNR